MFCFNLNKEKKKGPGQMLVSVLVGKNAVSKILFYLKKNFQTTEKRKPGHTKGSGKKLSVYPFLPVYAGKGD